MPTSDVVVIGAGVIGLSCAWRLADAGYSVTICDPHPATGASYLAAGMLAPANEAAYGETALTGFSLKAAQRWPSFADELEQSSGLSLGYRNEGTLVVGADASDRTALKDILAFQQELGLDSEWKSPGACQDIEPLLSSSVSGGIWSPSDHQVDNRLLLGALIRALEAKQVRVRQVQAQLDLSSAGAVRGVIAAGERVGASTVVLAAGWQAASLVPEPARACLPLRAVKGQILRLRFPDESLCPRVTVRALVKGSSVYVVPRAQAKIVIGATVEERGEDLSPTAGATYALLRDATTVLPVLHEAVLDEVGVGLRPGSPDNAPMIGATGIAGLIAATGHFRHGILFAPVTTDLVLSFLEQGSLPQWGELCSPLRFQR